MSGYTKLNYVNSGWVNADRGFYALPTYGLKFAPLGVDGQVDTEQAFQNFYGVQTTDEQNLTYDVAAETANTVYLKTVNSVLSLQSTVVSAGATIHPENRPRNIPVTQPKFGEIPKFTSTMPELAQEEIDDGVIYSSDFLGMYPFYYGNEIQDTTNVTLADNTNMVAPYNKTGYTFGGQILFHPTVSNDISDRSISPEKPWVKVYTSEQQRSWATLKNSARKSGLMTHVGSVYKGSFNPVSVWKISDPVMGYGGKKTQPHHNQPAIDKPFYNKGVEFYTQTQSSDASNVEAGTGYGWQYEIDRVDGLNLRYAIAGKKNVNGDTVSSWTTLNQMTGWYTGGIIRFRRNSTTSNTGYDGPVFEYETKQPVDTPTGFVPVKVGLYTYDEDVQVAYARVGLKIAIRKDNNEIWSIKFNSPANSGHPGIVDYMMDTLTPDKDVVTGQIGYMPKFYSIAFGFKKQGQELNICRPFLLIDNVYMEGSSDVDLSTILSTAGASLDATNAIETEESYFGKLGILCSASNAARTGGPTADIFMVSSGMTTVNKPFNNFTGSFYENLDIAQADPFLDNYIDNIDTWQDSAGFGKIIDAQAASLSAIVAGSGYQVARATKGVAAYLFACSFLGSIPLLQSGTAKAKISEWSQALDDYDYKYLTYTEWFRDYYGPMYYGQSPLPVASQKTLKLNLAPDRMQLTHPIAGTAKIVSSYDKQAYKGGFGFRFDAGVSFNSGMYILGQSPALVPNLDVPAPGGSYTPSPLHLVNHAWLDSKISVAQNGGSMEVASNSQKWRASVADDFVGLPTTFSAGDNYKTLVIDFADHGKAQVQFVQVYKKLSDRYVSIVPNAVVIKNPTGGTPQVLIIMSSAIDVKVQI